MSDRYQAIIVGSGVGGLAAAERLTAYGLRVLVIDDNPRPGGQLLRTPAGSRRHSRRSLVDRFKGRGHQLLARLDRSKLTWLQSAQVLGIYPDRTLLVEAQGGRVAEYRAAALILATGARERQVPFKGWTLPGVISTGAAQILLKAYGVLPGERPLVAGCSPLMLALAAQIVSGGGRVAAVLDESAITRKLRVFGAGAAILPKLLEGATYLTRILAARVPLQQQVRVVAARGKTALEAVVVADVDVSGRIRQGTERVYPADTLAIGHGFVPNIELPRQAGCRVAHAVGRGGWYVEVKETMETSLPGIYAVGETTGIAGGEKAFIEGRLAAWHLLRSHGKVGPQPYTRHVHALRRQRRRLLRYGDFLNRFCQPPRDLFATLPDDTILCRCEEITLGEVRRQIGRGHTTLNAIKRASRSGMGPCQGRICGPILSDLLSSMGHQNADAAGCTAVRAPVKAVSLGALANLGSLQEDGLPHQAQPRQRRAADDGR